MNSSGLTDFNPDLRDALATNTDAAMNILEFVRGTDRAGLLHLSTCYVAGERDGRVTEKLIPNYTPHHVTNFDAEQEWRTLHEVIAQAEAQAEGAEVTAGLKMQSLAKEHAAKGLQGAALENQIRKNRIRWLKTYLTEAGNAAGERVGLAEYLHADEEPGGIADCEVRRGACRLPWFVRRLSKLPWRSRSWDGMRESIRRRLCPIC